jgi:hypothetical protein
MNRFGWLVAAVVISAAGCCTRYALVQVPAVSMTIKSAEGQRASKIGPVKVKYCTGDKSISSQDSMVGLMDEAITIAEKQTGASFIADAKFFSDCGCVSLEGTAMKLEGPAAGVPSAQDSARRARWQIADSRDFARSLPPGMSLGCKQQIARR